LTPGLVLQRAHEPIREVFFPDGGVASVTTLMRGRGGVIRYVHGRITVLDRAGLERDSCECYATVRGHFARLQL
jgi:hypothetical protein